MSSQPSPASASAFSLKAPRQPMLWASVAYGGGIVLGIHRWRPASWWILAASVIILAALYLASKRPGLGWMLAFGALFLAGALHVQIRSGGPRVDTSILPFADRQRIEIMGHAIKDGRLRQEGSDQVRQTIDIQAEEVFAQGGVVVPVSSCVRLTIYSPPSDDAPHQKSAQQTAGPEQRMQVFRYGERIRCVARLRRPRNFRNPGTFDYEGYLAERGIAALGSADMQDIRLLPGFAGSQIQRWRSYLHRCVVAKVHELWPPREAALIDAMIIGEDAFIDRDTRVDFQRSGTYHTLVVSGMNVSILAFVVFWTLRRLRLLEIPTTVLTIGACVAYAFLTEVGPPVWRATLMTAVYLITRLLYRDRAMLNSIGTAALVLLIYDPRQILTPSFQMTFVCVLIVAGIALPILLRTSLLYAKALRNWDSTVYASQLPPEVAQFRLDLQLLAGRIAAFIGEAWSARILRSGVSCLFAVWELVFVSAVMQIGLALPMAYYFHRATTLGLPANVLVVPLTELMMPAAITALAIGSFVPWLAKLPILLTTVALHGITGTVRGLGSVQIADLRVAVPSGTVMLLAVAAVIFALWAARRHYAIATVGLAAILIMSLVLAIIPPAVAVRPGFLEFTSIDVGEGESSLLITPQGKMLLLDAGGPIAASGSQFDFGEDVVSPYLWSRGITRLDAVAVTHAHSDHIGGIASVLRNFRPKEFWVALEPPNAKLDQVLASAEALDISVIRRWEGDNFDFGGARFRVLYPARDVIVAEKPRNNDSMVLRVIYGETSMLLQGDAEKRVERYITSKYILNANVLKVGHHGSSNSTTAELVNRASPQFATISVGAANAFGLPRIETLERLAQVGARVYRTDLDGAVTFYLDGHSVTATVAAVP